ncbi:tumor necrosis factor receptor superfamily member 4 [Thunnus thynnus]|uniref:tumor necrosis factor receptor superfamily member 4 n=1 Tax=Thunnus thynnus TaxID=8237 RepID=UPI003528E9CE
MVPLKLLIFTLILCKLVADLDAKCPKGKKKTKDNGCADCQEGFFQPEENDSQRCSVCTKCDEKTTTVAQVCTKVTDRTCKCREGFVAWPNDAASCYCPMGFGLIKGETFKCSKCEHGHFSKGIDSACQKWKKCKSSVKENGTNMSDVTCNEEKNNNDITTATTSNKITSVIKHLRTTRPHEGGPTQEINRVTATTPTTTATVASSTKGTTIDPSNTGNQIGMTLLLFGIIGLLVLTAVTCRLHITPCVQRKPAVQPNDPLCRRPVEESGDDSLCPLKVNPGKL